MFYWGLGVGLFIGAFVGLVVASLCAMASRADEEKKNLIFKGDN